MKTCEFTGKCDFRYNDAVPYCKANYDCSYQKLDQAEVSHNTLFCVTRRYPRANPDNRYEIDKRVVQIEIETGKPLSDEFFNALTNLLSLYCG